MNKIIKALSVRQPWAGLIACGEKPIEYRSWKTSYRGDLLICSSSGVESKQTMEEEFPGMRFPQDFQKRFGPYFTTGVALCVVDLYRIKETWSMGYCDCEWHLRNPRPLPEPFPVKGKLNLFSVDLENKVVLGEPISKPKSEREKAKSQLSVPSDILYQTKRVQCSDSYAEICQEYRTALEELNKATDPTAQKRAQERFVLASAKLASKCK